MFHNSNANVEEKYISQGLTRVFVKKLAYICLSNQKETALNPVILPIFGKLNYLNIVLVPQNLLPDS